MVNLARKVGRAVVTAARAFGRGAYAAWPILVELAALATVCAGIGLVFVPASLVMGGAAVIFSVERIGRAASLRAAREGRP